MKITDEIDKQLTELNIPHTSFRNGEVIWCPRYPLKRDEQVAVVDYRNDKLMISCCYTLKEAEPELIFKTVNQHECICELLKFYYGEVDNDQ